MGIGALKAFVAQWGCQAHKDDLAHIVGKDSTGEHSTHVLIYFIPCLTLPYLALPYLALPYLTLPYRTLLSLPILFYFQYIVFINMCVQLSREGKFVISSVQCYGVGGEYESAASSSEV